jgi:FMN phosphatase YigB (HAD superfamily)
MTRSWDFWDTLVTRCVLAPADVFDITERITGVTGFAAARQVAEVNSRKGVSETTLDRIYSFLAYEEAQKRTLLETEVRVELQLASPIMANVARWSNEDVVISDMYLDQATMMRIAASCGIELPADRLYLSSELGATKHTGQLFDEVQRHFRLQSHVGDNVHSDVAMPARKGISSAHFKESMATTTERNWLRVGSKNARLVAGVLRATRLAEPPAGGYDAGEWVLYSQLVAPLLLRFVDWTLRCCEQRGIEHVFFMARDGQILHRIACALIRERASNLESHYMFASRQALHLPGHSSMKQSASWIADNTTFLSVRVIAERIGVDVERVAALSARYVSTDVDENLDAAERSRLAALMEDSDFAELVRSHSAIALVGAASYFREIGLLNPVHNRVGIVDVGWVGRVQRSLESISRKSGLDPERIHGFYLGLAAGSVHASGDRCVGMLADPYRAELVDGGQWVNAHRGMFEFFLRANHPTTVGYREDSDGRHVPRLGAPLSDSAKLEIQRKQDAIMAFVDRYCRLEALVGPALADALSPADTQMRRLLERPTKEEARVFFGGVHSEHQVERDVAQMVASPSVVDAFRRHTTKRFGLWPEASFALSAAPWLFRLRKLVAQIWHLRL